MLKKRNLEGLWNHSKEGLAIERYHPNSRLWCLCLHRWCRDKSSPARLINDFPNLLSRSHNVCSRWCDEMWSQNSLKLRCIYSKCSNTHWSSSFQIPSPATASILRCSGPSQSCTGMQIQLMIISENFIVLQPLQSLRPINYYACKINCQMCVIVSCTTFHWSLSKYSKIRWQLGAFEVGVKNGKASSGSQTT